MSNMTYEVKNCIKSFDLINTTDLHDHIGVCNGFDGMTSRYHSDVILYNKNFVDLYEALRALCNNNICDIRAKMSKSCYDLYEYIMQSPVFLPVLAILSMKAGKPVFSYKLLSGKHEEELRELLVVLSGILDEIYIEKPFINDKILELGHIKEIFESDNIDYITAFYRKKLKTAPVFSGERQRYKEVLRSLYTSKFNEIKQSELSFVQTALEEQATELDHLIEIRDCIKACTDCIVEFLEVDIFNVMDLVLFLQKSLDKREETDEE